MFITIIAIQAQPKYYEKEIGWGWTQACANVFFLSDTSIALGCGGVDSIGAFERVTIVFSDVNLNNKVHTTYGGDTCGRFVLLEMITTVFGYTIVGTMRDSPSTDYGHAYMLEVNHEGEITAFYDLRDTPYESNAQALCYLPATNTYYVGGNAFTIASQPDKLWIAKITNGEVVWRRYYEGYTYRNLITDLLPAEDGGCYAGGFVHSNYSAGGLTGDFWLAKILPNGDIAWEETYDPGSQDNCGDVLRTDDNGFVLSGVSNHNQARLIRIDSLREVVWSKQYFPGEYTSVIGKAYQENGYFICVGIHAPYLDSKAEAFIMKVRGNDGEPIWTRFYDMNVNHDYFYNFTPTPDGGFMCVGRTEPAGSANVYVVKTNCRGTLDYPRAEFVLSINEEGDMATVTNQSDSVFGYETDGGHFEWDFGDGSPATVSYNHNTSFTHAYQFEQVPQIYPVTLRAFLCNDTATFVRTACFGVTSTPQAAFTHSMGSNGSINFANQSTNTYPQSGGTYTWNFGDGTPPITLTGTTAGETLSHTYAADGNYTVTLQAAVCGDTSTTQQPIAVTWTSVADTPIAAAPILSVTPNPADEVLHIVMNKENRSGTWHLYDATGRRVIYYALTNPTTAIPIADLPEGMYFWQFYGDNTAQNLQSGKIVVLR